MAYDSTIPSLSNLIGDDIPQMQENFQLLEDSQIVDEGSTNDGDYIRYENGWQVCWKTDFKLNNIAGSTDFWDWSFPVPFNSTPMTNIIVHSPYLYNQSTNDDDDIVKDLPYVFARREENDYQEFQIVKLSELGLDDLEEDDLKAQVFAIGRWK